MMEADSLTGLVALVSYSNSRRQTISTDTLTGRKKNLRITSIFR